jgi:hypothetical protein
VVILGDRANAITGHDMLQAGFPLSGRPQFPTERPCDLFPGNICCEDGCPNFGRHLRNSDANRPRMECDETRLQKSIDRTGGPGATSRSHLAEEKFARLQVRGSKGRGTPSIRSFGTSNRRQGHQRVQRAQSLGKDGGAAWRAKANLPPISVRKSCAGRLRLRQTDPVAANEASSIGTVGEDVLNSQSELNRLGGANALHYQ